MSFKNQVIVILLCYFISLIFVRGFLYGIKRYQLNNSAYKKRKKEETFREWLFYISYKEDIPKLLRVLYYSVLILHPFGLGACLFAYIIVFSLNIGEIIAIAIASLDVVWMLVIAVLFWSPGRDYAYERWIAKKRGQNRKNK